MHFISLWCILGRNLSIYQTAERKSRREPLFGRRYLRLAATCLSEYLQCWSESTWWYLTEVLRKDSGAKSGGDEDSQDVELHSDGFVTKLRIYKLDIEL